MPASYRFVVTGRVQGVGFRVFAQRCARRLGLPGWVRNRHDGSVEGCVGGDEDTLQTFRSELERGPAGAQVWALQWEPQAEAPMGEGFAILR
jgi:acylphosphatase